MIATTGTIVADLLTHPVAEMPGKGELTAVDRVELHLGGAVPNTGMVLSQLGTPVGAVGCVGRDTLGRLVTEELSRWAEALWLQEDETRSTSGNLVLVHSDGERTFLFANGANAGLREEHLPWESLIEAGARAVHLGYALLLPGLDGPPLARALEKARKLGLLVSLDVAWTPTASWEDLLKLLPYVDVFCPNLREAEAITGVSDPSDAAEVLLSAGVREVVAIKRGRDGCYVRPAERPGEHLPAHEVPVVDTTGAGDAFVAGMLAAWYRGYDWATAGRIANSVGAMATIGLGAAEGIGSWKEVLSLATVPSQGGRRVRRVV